MLERADRVEYFERFYRETTSGILNRDPIRQGANSATVDGAIDAMTDEAKKNGYEVVVDGIHQRAVRSFGTAVFEGLGTGDHLVVLVGVGAWAATRGPLGSPAALLVMPPKTPPTWHSAQPAERWAPVSANVAWAKWAASHAVGEWQRWQSWS
mgnify:CR=1 FL=1